MTMKHLNKDERGLSTHWVLRIKVGGLEAGRERTNVIQDLFEFFVQLCSKQVDVQNPARKPSLCHKDLIYY